MAKQSIWVLLFIIGRMKISIINRKRTPTAICGKRFAVTVLNVTIIIWKRTVFLKI